MARPNCKVELTHKYLTAPQARKRLGLSRWQFDLRVNRGVFPKPTYVDVTGVRYFDENWVKIAKLILDSAPEEERQSVRADTQ